MLGRGLATEGKEVGGHTGVAVVSIDLQDVPRFVADLDGVFVILVVIDGFLQLLPSSSPLRIYAHFPLGQVFEAAESTPLGEDRELELVACDVEEFLRGGADDLVEDVVAELGEARPGDVYEGEGGREEGDGNAVEGLGGR